VQVSVPEVVKGIGAGPPLSAADILGTGIGPVQEVISEVVSAEECHSKAELPGIVMLVGEKEAVQEATPDGLTITLAGQDGPGVVPLYGINVQSSVPAVLNGIATGPPLFSGLSGVPGGTEIGPVQE
jgi:hypothetical protein